MFPKGFERVLDAPLTSQVESISGEIARAWDPTAKDAPRSHAVDVF